MSSEISGAGGVSQGKGPTARKGMVLPFTPLAMSFGEVNYYVDMPSVCYLKHQQPNPTYWQLGNPLDWIWITGNERTGSDRR